MIMKRFLSLLSLSLNSLIIMAGDRLPGSSKPWSVQFSIFVLVAGVILFVVDIKKQNNGNEKENYLGAIGFFMVLAGIMGLVSTCVTRVIQ